MDLTLGNVAWLIFLVILLLVPMGLIELAWTRFLERIERRIRAGWTTRLGKRQLEAGPKNTDSRRAIWQVPRDGGGTMRDEFTFVGESIGRDPPGGYGDS